MIFTNISKIGDFILTWPIASWWYKTYNQKIDWLLTKNYPVYESIKPFLEIQEFTSSVTLVDVGINALNPDEWKFDPTKFGFEGPYLNLGIPTIPTYYFPKVYVDGLSSDIMHLDIDENFKPRVIEEQCDTFDTVSIPLIDGSRNFDHMLRGKNVHYLSLDDSWNYNLNVALKAKNIFLGMSSFSIMLDLLGIGHTIFCQQHHHYQTSWFYKNPSLHRFIIQ